MWEIEAGRVVEPWWYSTGVQEQRSLGTTDSKVILSKGVMSMEVCREQSRKQKHRWKLDEDLKTFYSFREERGLVSRSGQLGGYGWCEWEAHPSLSHLYDVSDSSEGAILSVRKCFLCVPRNSFPWLFIVIFYLL